ncbi:MAG: ATP-dependent helicase [Anaerolineaceae bacterium]|nr:ATP-dependent helicase [Anaerolineaceae bacterium]
MQTKDIINPLINSWKKKENYEELISHYHLNEAFDGAFCDLPTDIHPDLASLIQLMGIHQLYEHQLKTYDLVSQGKNVVINTGTASGKTLAFQLPILNQCFKNSLSTALFIYPTKALAYDQLTNLQDFNQAVKTINKKMDFRIGIYDGDTPKGQRSKIRKTSRILLTNPDMLHYAILPYHTNWETFLMNLRYIVIDEIHIYRGVFGSHVGNVFRRLQRVFELNGVSPQIICTTATIGNPKEFAEKLFERQFSLVDKDGSPHGKKHFILYNPPIINPELGVRKSALQETISVTSDLLDFDIQTLIFQVSRRSVEISLRKLREIYPLNRQNIQAYRSGYLASERRALESDLRNGKIKALFSTNALELGIDIGSLSAVVIAGYPGTIASTQQQMGRSGRHLEPSLAMMIASPMPIDQYLVQNPDFIFRNSPENVLINPNNPLILLHHLRCASHELFFQEGETFGNLSWEEIAPYIEILKDEGNLYYSNNRFMWISDLYPAAEISLRNMGGNPVKLIEILEDQEILIGQIDYSSSLWMVHPGAVYMHLGENYVVTSLDLDQSKAYLNRKMTMHYTEPKRETEIDLKQIIQQKSVNTYQICFGNIDVTSQITAYKERLWDTHEIIKEEPLDLPSVELSTEACWINFSDEMVNKLRESELWNNDPADYGKNWIKTREMILQRDQFTCQLCKRVEDNKSNLHIHHKTPIRMFSSIEEANQPNNLVTLCVKCHQRVEVNVKIRSGLAGVGYIIRSLSPLFLMCDLSDIEIHLDPVSKLNSGQPICMLYDTVPFGIGLSQKLYEIFPQIFQASLNLAKNCECDDGCPACIGPVAENGYGSKKESIAILSLLVGNNE